MPVGPAQWHEALDAALEERNKARAQAQAKATTWCLGEANTPSWQALELEEKFLGNAATGDESKGRESQRPALPCATDEDQIPVLIVALDPSWATYQWLPLSAGRPEDDTPLAVGEYNARGVSPTSARGASPAAVGVAPLAGRASTRRWTQLQVPSGMIPSRRNGRVASTRSWQEN